MKPPVMKLLGVLALAFGSFLFVGYTHDRDDPDSAAVRNGAFRLEGYGLFFGIGGLVLLLAGFMRDNVNAPAAPPAPARQPLTRLSEQPRNTVPPSSPTSSADTSLRLADAHPDIHALFSSDAMFQKVILEIIQGNLIRAIKTMREDTHIGLAEAKERVDCLKATFDRL
jgi:hypothetical protein